jgi:hypothetical protein
MNIEREFRRQKYRARAAEIDMLHAQAKQRGDKQTMRVLWDEGESLLEEFKREEQQEINLVRQFKELDRQIEDVIARENERIRKQRKNKR